MMFKIYCRVFQFAMKYGAYFLPWRKPRLIEGAGSVAKLPERISSRGIKSVLLVTDKGITALGLTAPLLEALDKAQIRTAVYDETVPNPTIDNIEEALRMYKENNCGGLIAFGGGSAMDCAKGVGARVARPRTSIARMKGLLKIWRRLPPLYAVPTTSGTGSEATLAAVVVNSKTQEKYALMDFPLIPHEAVLDPLLTEKLPPFITATTGMDALTHAVEAYIGRSNTRETREMAASAVALVFDNLYKAYEDGSNLEARANMQRAAYYGGVAFTRAYVGNVHAAAHTLGGMYGTAHGLANAVILPYVLDDYGECVYEPLARLADVVNLPGKNAEQKAKAFIKAIRDLNSRMGIPSTIDGIKEEDIPLMAKRAHHEANPVYPVPRIFTVSDFISIYHRLMGKSGIPGFAGKMARIDLTTGKTEEFCPQRGDLIKFLGGKGIAAKIIYDELDGKTEAFSDENLIVITTSPLVASSAPSSSRFNISTISPLTGLLVSSNCGGDFGLRLRRAGYDALVISGKSERKVYIRVGEEGIEICDAEDIWGKKTAETQALMGAGGKLAIGPAGENFVRYACVASGERVAGRGGVGAVFGYKGLKGIVADGNKTIELSERDRFRTFNKKWIATLQKHALTGGQLPKLGTAGLMRMMQNTNLLASRNYSSGRFEDFDKISGETMREEHLVKNKGCTSCPIRCGRVVMQGGGEIKGPELETLGLLGSNLCSGDLERIIRVNYLCDEYGIDTMSFGASVGFAMELGEKGLWDNGLRFGDCEGLETLVHQTAMREGIGGDLAEGVRLMSEKYGGAEFAIHVKGMELAAYEPRAAQGMGLGYATANRGGCHLNGGYMVVLEGLGMRVSGRTTKGKAALTVFFQDLMEAASAGGSCLFTTYAVFPPVLVSRPNNPIVRAVCTLMPYFGGIVSLLHNRPGLLGINAPGIVPHAYAYKLITGGNMNIGRFTRSGERIYNLERLVNVRQGLYDGDTLPRRLTDEPQQEGDDKSRVHLEPMLKKYYRIRGWDTHGVPKQKRLRKLGL